MPEGQTGKVTGSQQSTKRSCSDTHYICFIFTFIFLDGEIWIVDHFRKKTVQEIMPVFRIIFVNGTNDLNYLQQKTLSLSIHTPDKHTVLKNQFHSIGHILICLHARLKMLICNLARFLETFDWKSGELGLYLAHLPCFQNKEAETGAWQRPVKTAADLGK